MSRFPGLSSAPATIAGIVLLCAGCSMPFQVAYVDDPSAEIRGIRYKLKRPAYSVNLQLDLQHTNVFDRVAGLYVAGPYLGCSTEEECQHPDPVLSIRAKPSDLCITNLAAIILLTQTLSKDRTFEVRNDDALSILKTLLADSQLSVTVDDEGYLTSMSSKVDDQILPFIVAVAGLTVSIAKGLAAVPVPEVERPRCFPELDAPEKVKFLGLTDEQQDAFLSYIHRHVSLAARKRTLESALHRTETALTAAAPGELKDLLQAIAGLDQETKTIVEQLKIVSYSVPADKYVLRVDGVHVAGKGQDQSNWVEIKLDSGREL